MKPLVHHMKWEDKFNEKIQVFFNCINLHVVFRLVDEYDELHQILDHTSLVANKLRQINFL